MNDRRMQIAVIGFGNVGAHLARLWKAAGHSVTVGLRPGSAREEDARRSGATVLQPDKAAASADVVALAIPWQAVEETLSQITRGGAQWTESKILVDATNPLRGDLSVIVPETGSGGQQVARWAERGRVVKAFNTIGAAYFGNPDFDALYCGDDPEAKSIVRGLIADTTMHPVDVGPLENARYLEHIAGLWINLAVHGRVQGPFWFNLVPRTNPERSS
jgi:NADPH-dependent F420 reductase